ncbi:protoporphyrinogen/coproporphyrinogen oxidase, partial [Cellulomonas massiliensis]|uniref:protoporphyrinogen/coproporphyrinogen oxidase n=1 Tax=Cellulomonas massiliensis TaxID=1465811 RepID=UPI00037D1BF8
VARVRAAAPAGAAVLGLDGGIATLADALVADVERLGGEVRLRSRVDAARVEDDAVVLEVDGGGTERTARLVVAAPRPDLVAAATGGADLPALDEGAAVVLVTLVLDEPALDRAPRGTGVLVGPAVTDVRAKALTHGTAKWAWLAREAGPGRHVVRLSYGRADEPVDALPTGDALVDQALRDASVLLGVPLVRDRLAGSAVVRWTQALPRPSAAHRAAVAAVRSAVGGSHGRVAVAGAWVAGNGLASVVPDARAAARTLV